MPKSKEKCKKIREETKAKILSEAIKFFSINGFDGTKISDFAKSLGIAQGTMYRYFESKEELFNEVLKIANIEKEINKLHLLKALPIKAITKINNLSKYIIDSFEDINFIYKITLNTQLMLKNNNIFQSDLYKYTAKIFDEGIKESIVIADDPLKLDQINWSNIYVYALTIIFTKDYKKLTEEYLNRMVVRK